MTGEERRHEAAAMGAENRVRVCTRLLDLDPLPGREVHSRGHGGRRVFIRVVGVPEGQLGNVRHAIYEQTEVGLLVVAPLRNGEPGWKKETEAIVVSTSAVNGKPGFRLLEQGGKSQQQFL